MQVERCCLVCLAVPTEIYRGMMRRGVGSVIGVSIGTPCPCCLRSTVHPVSVVGLICLLLMLLKGPPCWSALKRDKNGVQLHILLADIYWLAEA